MKKKFLSYCKCRMVYTHSSRGGRVFTSAWYPYSSEVMVKGFVTKENEMHPGMIHWIEYNFYMGIAKFFHLI